MPLSKTVKVGSSLNPADFIVSDGGDLVVSGLPTSYTIPLGLILTDEDKAEILEGLARQNFMSFRAFTESLGVAKVNEGGQFGFVDLKFARALQTHGLPMEYAFKTAYLTSITSVENYEEKRQALWDHFRAVKHDVKLEHREGYSGITTLDVYLFLGILSNEKIADAILERAIGEPAQMIAAIRTLSDFLDSEYKELLESASNLSTLMKVFSPNFPSRKGANGDLVYPGMVKFLSLNVPWKVADDLRAVAYKQEFPLTKFVQERMGGPGTLLQEHSVIAILNAVYTEAVAKRAEDYLAANSSLLLRGGHSLLVLLAVLEYFKNDGSPDTPINWVAAASLGFSLDEVFRTSELVEED